MGKLIVFLSFLNLLGLEIGSIWFSSAAVMGLATSSVAYIVVRAFIIVLLLALLSTHPPRNLLLRVLVGAVGTGVLLSTIILTEQDDMQLLDTLTLAAAAISMGITALELNYSADDSDSEAEPGVVSFKEYKEVVHG